jgi:hypothetical protein
MAHNEYDLDDDFDEYDDGALQQVRKAHKAATKRVKELESELASLRVESRNRSVADVLSSRGYNPKIADLIPGDLTTEDQITSWLDERGDLFSPNQAGSQATSEEQMGDQPGIKMPPELQRMNEVVNAGEAPTGDESQILAMIQAASSPEELNRLIFGNPNGPTV